MQNQSRSEKSYEYLKRSISARSLKELFKSTGKEVLLILSRTNNCCAQIIVPTSVLSNGYLKQGSYSFELLKFHDFP